MSDFLEQLRAGFIACQMEGTRVLLAVSGGPDSVALLHGALELRESLRLDVTAAHLNHGLRGDASNGDAEWVRKLCDALGVHVFIANEDVAALAAEKGIGIEEAARNVRYSLLEAIAMGSSCKYVAVGHTADDQVETVLHHMLRGTGLDGLGGMPQLRPLDDQMTLARPMLAIRRDVVREYLALIGQDFRIDESNSDESFTRSRIRNTMLPLLRQEFNPQVDDALVRLAQQAREAGETLSNLAEKLLNAAVLEEQDWICRIDCDVLRDQPRHLVREVFVRLWRRLRWPRQRMGYAEWNRLAELLSGEGTDNLPGDVLAQRRGKLLVLLRRQQKAES